MLRLILTIGLALLPGGKLVQASDYAATVVDYDNTNSAEWNDPTTVLGRPSIDTEGDFAMFEDIVVVLPVFAPWKSRSERS